MRKNNFMNKILKLKGSILAGIIQIFACLIVYKFNIPNPNIVLFVVLSASIVQSGYLAGMNAHLAKPLDIEKVKKRFVNIQLKYIIKSKRM